MVERDPNRIPEVLAELEKYWKRNSDLRLTQIMVNFFGRQDGVSVPMFYNTEDDVVIQRLKDENED